MLGAFAVLAGIVLVVLALGLAAIVVAGPQADIIERKRADR